MKDQQTIQLKSGQPLDRNRFLAQAINGITDYAIFLLDASGTILTWNAGAERIQGYKGSEIVGQHFSIFYTPEDQARMHPQEELEIAKRAGKYEEEGWRVRKDGSRFWSSVLLTAAYDDRGQLIGFSKVTRDLTEQKEIEGRLLEANRKLDELLQERTHDLEATTGRLTLVANALPSLISFIDKDLRYQFVNPAYENWFDRQKADIVGKTMAEVLGADAVEALRPMIEKALAGQQVFFETEVPYKTGTRWIEGTYIPHRSRAGTVIGIAVLVSDITERKHAQERLLASEERLRLALEAARMGVYERNHITGSVVWSPQARAILRGKPEKLDEDFNSFFSRIEQKDQLHFRAEAMKAASEGRTIDMVFRYHRPDGQLRWLHAYGKGVLDSDGKTTREIGVLQDVTDQKNAVLAVEIERTKLHNLLLQAPAIFSVLRGPEHVFEIFNIEARKTIGGRDCTGLPIREALPELEGKGFFEALDRVYQTGEPIHLRESPAELVQSDGSIRTYYLNVVYHPWRDVDGKIAGIMNVSMDVTEQVLARRRLEEALQSRDEFMSIASHELKTPLTSLKLQTQMRQRAVAKGDREALSLDRMRGLFDGDLREINRLSRLIDDMLDISRISTGKLALRPERLDLFEVIKEVVDRYRPQFEEAGSQIHLTSCAPVSGDWDRGRIEQVVSNLLMNALRYGARKPVHVQVDAKNHMARIIVKDQGIGIAQENLARIFERFERAISPNEVTGLGLGLFIVRQIVEMHGGSVHVESELGKGSTFIVDLPLSLSGGERHGS